MKIEKKGEAPGIKFIFYGLLAMFAFLLIGVSAGCKNDVSNVSEPAGKKENLQKQNTGVTSYRGQKGHEIL